ncbi:MAG: hypothetical protein ACOYYS_08745 [Chloroflexota bacterium]
MNKLFLLLAALVVVLALLIALASASAGLANGVANAAASSALLVSQCTLAVMVFVSLAAGVAIGSSIAGMRARRQLERPFSHTPPVLPQAAAKRLPESETPALYLPGASEPEEADEALFQHWGW